MAQSVTAEHRGGLPERLDAVLAETTPLPMNERRQDIRACALDRLTSGGTRSGGPEAEH